MSEGSATKGLRERLTSGTEDRLGRALSDLFESSLLNGALGRASDAREKATQAQELAMGALNLPSAADIERLTRRLRSVSQRLEGIEDGVHRLGRTFPGQSIDSRLGAIEEQLKALAKTLGEIRPSSAGAKAGAGDVKQGAGGAKSGAGGAKAGAASAKRAAAKPVADKPAAAKSKRTATARKPTAKRSSAGARRRASTDG